MSLKMSIHHINQSTSMEYINKKIFDININKNILILLYNSIIIIGNRNSIDNIIFQNIILSMWAILSITSIIYQCYMEIKTTYNHEILSKCVYIIPMILQLIIVATILISYCLVEIYTNYGNLTEIFQHSLLYINMLYMLVSILIEKLYYDKCEDIISKYNFNSLKL